MSEKIKPELFPVLIGEKVHFVKRGDYAKSISSSMAIELKAEITRTHVTDFLEAIEKGKKRDDLPPDAPKELVKLFEKIEEDYQSAIEEVERVKKEKEDAEAKAAQEAKEKLEAEQQLFLEVKNETADFNSVAKAFDSGENLDRFVVKGNVKDEVLFGAFNLSLEMANFTNWMTGDLINELEKRGHLGVITKLAEDKGKSFKTLYKAAKVARIITPEQRQKGVSFTVYAEIASARFDADEKKHEAKLLELVNEANTIDETTGKSKMTTQTAREAVKKAQGKKAPDPVAPEDNEKRRFLVVGDGTEGDEVQVATGFPKEAFVTGAIVIDLTTGLQFVKNGFAKAAKDRWVALKEWKKPEPKVEPKSAPAAKKGAAKKK